MCFRRRSFGFTPAHVLLTEFRADGLRTAADLLGALLSTQLVELHRRDNEGHDLLMRAVERLNVPAVEQLLAYSRKHWDGSDTGAVGRDSWLFAFAIKVKMEFDGVATEEQQERLAAIHQLLSEFYFLVEAEARGHASAQEAGRAVDAQAVSTGLARLCVETQRRPGQVEMLATALGQQVQGVSRQQLLYQVNLRWMEVMRVMLKEERQDLLVLVSRDPDLVEMLRGCTEQEMRELYADCATDRSALFAVEGKSSIRGECEKINAPWGYVIPGHRGWRAPHFRHSSGGDIPSLELERAPAGRGAARAALPGLPLQLPVRVPGAGQVRPGEGLLPALPAARVLRAGRVRGVDVAAAGQKPTRH